MGNGSACFTPGMWYFPQVWPVLAGGRIFLQLNSDWITPGMRIFSYLWFRLSWRCFAGVISRMVHTGVRIYPQVWLRQGCWVFSTLQKPRVFDLRCEKSFYSKNQRCVIFMNAGFICVKICSKLRADKVTMVYWLVGVGALSIWFRQ